MKNWDLKNKGWKAEKKPFIGYETFIISALVIVFSITGLIDFEWGKYRPLFYANKLFGFWAKPIFWTILYLAILEFFRRKVQRALISKFSSIITFVVASTIMFESESGLLGFYTFKLLKAIISEVWIWKLFATILYFVSISLFVFKTPFTLIIKMFKLIAKIFPKKRKIKINKETLDSSKINYNELNTVGKNNITEMPIRDSYDYDVVSNDQGYSKKIKSIFDLIDDNVDQDNNISEIKNKDFVNGNTYPKSLENSQETKQEITYVVPSKNLLKDVKPNEKHKKNIASAIKTSEPLINVLNEFGIPAKIEDTVVGPSVTRYELKIPSHIKISRITAIENNIKMMLQARSLRIQAPIPGKALIGIEIPNRYSTLVDFKTVINDQPINQRKNPLSVALGKDIEGKSAWLEINKTPHMLIAGATGSGKSVCINTILASILLHASPEQVKLILVDPKMVEFTPFREIPHLLAPIITNPNHAKNTLEQVVLDMEARYKKLAELGVRKIEDYNNKVGKSEKMPYIIIIIDELADLMMDSSKEVETLIARIAQKARAAGIHLILATQRPSKNIVTGLIKSNIPTRISFALPTTIDSRIILDAIGAEKLLGKGDMLVKSSGMASKRYQGAYIDDEELESIISFVKNQGKPKYANRYLNLKDKISSALNKESESLKDPLFNDVKRFVIDYQKASSSLLQRKFSIGYGRAARLIDALESQGIVGPTRGSKPREVLKKAI